VRFAARPAKTSRTSKEATCFGSLGPSRLALVAALSLIAAGCAHHPHVARTPVPSPPAQPAPSAPPPAIETQPAVPGEYVEEGVASWYGIPFDGHRTSNGDVYDMHALTAAHRTLPFNSVVRVTNLRNGRQTEVRINDRGPFVGDRVIDLSLAAAQALDMEVAGVARVRLELLGGPNPRIGFFGVQVGAFRVQDNAERLRDQLQAGYAPVNIVLYDSPTGLFYRVRVGRVPAEDAATRLAGQLRSREHLTTFVVRLDD